MELREFAERVLFATSLEEKLLRADDITDERPGPALVTPAITSATQFWVRVRSACGTVDSVTVTVTPSEAQRRRPSHS